MVDDKLKLCRLQFKRYADNADEVCTKSYSPFLLQCATTARAILETADMAMEQQENGNQDSWRWLGDALKDFKTENKSLYPGELQAVKTMIQIYNRIDEMQNSNERD